MAVSGIKSELDELTEKFIYQYVTSNHKNYTFEEIEKAFYFNSTGQLAQRHEHFGLFDTTFFSKVMEDWLILKTKTRQRAASLLPPTSEAVMSDEDSYNGLVAYYKKHNSFPKFWAWSKVYQHMDDSMMIEENNQTKQELYDYIYTQFKSKLDLDILDMKNATDRKERQESLPNDVKIECRRIMVQKHLKL